MNDDSWSQQDGASGGKSRGLSKKGADFDRTKDGSKEGNFGSSSRSDAAGAGSATLPAQNLTESVKGLATEAGEKLLEVAETEKAAGADFVGGMAGAIRRAAHEFESDVPQAAEYIRSAADQIDYVTQAFRQRNINQLLNDVQDFARRQPTAFLGATVLAGFVAMRFLKSSTSEASRSSQAHSPDDPARLRAQSRSY